MIRRVRAWFHRGDRGSAEQFAEFQRAMRQRQAVS